jgi:hypothetical protein
MEGGCAAGLSADQPLPRHLPGAFAFGFVWRARGCREGDALVAGKSRGWVGGWACVVLCAVCCMVHGVCDEVQKALQVLGAVGGSFDPLFALIADAWRGLMAKRECVRDRGGGGGGGGRVSEREQPHNGRSLHTQSRQYLKRRR